MSDNLRRALYRLIVGAERDADDHAGLRTTDYNEGLDDGALGIIQDLKRILNEHPEPETTTEWAVRWGKHDLKPSGVREESAFETADWLNKNDPDSAAYFGAKAEVVTREVTAWKKADQ